MKQSFGNRLKNLLFEEEEVIYNEEFSSLSFNDSNYGEDIQTQSITNIEVDTSNISTIEDIYKAGDIEDLSKSIYKIEEIKSVLPNTLPTATKKESVIGMMKVSNITLDEILDDADYRKNALEDVLIKFTDDTTKIIEESSNEIKELEERINELKESINARKLEQEQQSKIIKDEITKINSIIEFML